MFPSFASPLSAMLFRAGSAYFFLHHCKMPLLAAVMMTAAAPGAAMPMSITASATAAYKRRDPRRLEPVTMGLLVDNAVFLQMLDEVSIRNPLSSLIAVQDVIADVLHATSEIEASVASHVGAF